MNNVEFVDYIKRQLLQSSIDAVKSNITAPSGRQPHQKYITMSSWYNSKNESDKEHVNLIIKEAVETTLFGFLTILDNVAAIDKKYQKGKFELNFTDNHSSKLINDPKDDFLHDLFNEESK
jgi:hypothetical protein